VAVCDPNVVFSWDRVTTTFQVPPLGSAVFWGDVMRKLTGWGFG
jgi:hypothetical protein